MNYYCGVDIGQAQDFSAVTIAQRVEYWLPQHNNPGRQRCVTACHIVHLHRFPLGMSYPEQIRRIRSLVERPEVKGQIMLSLDVTGVGKPIYDAFCEAKLSCPVRGILIHAGHAVSRDGTVWHVPKRDLIGAVQVVLQTGRLKFVASLPALPLLITEFQNFRMKVNPTTAHDSYNAREGAHDDLLLSVAIAVWSAQHCTPSAMGVKILNGY